MDEFDPCEVCALTKQLHVMDGDTRLNTVTCARCGTYVWAANARRSRSQAVQVRLAGRIRDLNRAGIVPTVDAQMQIDATRIPIPRLQERAMRLLQEVARNAADAPRTPRALSDQPIYLGASYSSDARELQILCGILVELKLLEYRAGARAYVVTPSGFIAAEDAQSPTSRSATGFVAMSFDPDMMDAYVYGFDPGIRAAGYRPVRIDKKEHANPISDEIMAEIRRARFVVADYTQGNNGVYFEAGFATGLGILVIPTCRKSEMSSLHFDIRHINTLPWESPTELADALAKRISAILGDGPVRSI